MRWSCLFITLILATACSGTSPASTNGQDSPAAGDSATLSGDDAGGGDASRPGVRPAPYEMCAYACTQDSDCGAGYLCAQGVCVDLNHAFVPCQDDSDCLYTASRPFCMPSGVCAECEADTDCIADLTRCIDGTCGCANDSECVVTNGTFPHCRSDGTCGCTSDAECQKIGDEKCSATAHCGHCATDADCAGAFSVCVQGSCLCASDAECVAAGSAGFDACYADGCGCSSAAACPPSPFPNATAVCR